MAQILVVRHGQSTWNAEGRWQGQQDPELSDLGRRQAAAAAAAVGAVDLVAASDLRRASMTAAIIAEAIGVGPVRTHTGFRERTAGPFEGLTRAEIEHRYPGWLDDGVRPEGWEPDESVAERAVEGLADIAADVGPDGTALVVAHSGVIYVLEDLLAQRWFGRIPNLGGRWFTTAPGGLHLGDRLLLVPEELLTVPGQA